MTIRRGPMPDKNWTWFFNTTLQDTNLSCKARGLLVYLISQPPDYRVSSKRLPEVLKEGKDSILGALKELEDQGYLEREKCRDEDGKFSTDSVVYATNRGRETRPGPDQDLLGKSPGGTGSDLPGSDNPSLIKEISIKKEGDLELENPQTSLPEPERMLSAREVQDQRSAVDTIREQFNIKKGNP